MRSLCFGFGANNNTHSDAANVPISWQPQHQPARRRWIDFFNRLGQAVSPEDWPANYRTFAARWIKLCRFWARSMNTTPTRSPAAGKPSQHGVGDCFRRVAPQPGCRPELGTQPSSLGANNLFVYPARAAEHQLDGAVGTSPATIQDLIALQNDLQPVAAILQRLNVSGAMNQSTAPYNNGTVPLPIPTII